MTAIDRLAKTGIDLRISKNIYGKITVSFKNAYLKDACLLIGNYGRGDTVEEAALDYINALQGKTVVVNPTSKDRREIVLV